MKMREKVLALGFVLAWLASGSYYAQQESTTYNIALGDIARQVKAQKAKEHKPLRVVTNDNIAALDNEAVGASSKGAGSADSATPAIAVQGQPATSSSQEECSALPQGASPSADLIGFVQTADGKIEAVVANGNSVCLVAQTPKVTTARDAPPAGSPAGASPARGSTAPAAEVISTRGAVPDNPVHPQGRTTPALPSVITQTSYQVPPPGPGVADGSAPGRMGQGLTGQAAGRMGGTTGLAASTMEPKPAGSTDRPAKLPVSIKPIGYVVEADGVFAAIVSQDDEIYIVRQGDSFAGRYHALSVTASAVEAVEEPPIQTLPSPHAAPPAFPGVLSASAQQGSPQLSNEGCSICNSHGLGKVSRKRHGEAPAKVALLPNRNREAKRARLRWARWAWRRSTHSFRRTTNIADINTAVFQTIG